MTKILSQSEVAAIRERAAKATPQRWHFDGFGTHLGVEYVVVNHEPSLAQFYIRKDQYSAGEWDFLNEPYNLQGRMAALCDTVDALRAKLEVAKAELQGIAEYWNGAPESAVDAIETVADRAHNCLASLKEPQ